MSQNWRIMETNIHQYREQNFILGEGNVWMYEQKWQYAAEWGNMNLSYIWYGHKRINGWITYIDMMRST